MNLFELPEVVTLSGKKFRETIELGPTSDNTCSNGGGSDNGCSGGGGSSNSCGGGSGQEYKDV